MTKQEFMTELQRALNGRMGSAKAAPHVSYYQEYIEIEMRKGRPEEEVMEELGSPRLLAKSICEVSDKEAPDAPYAGLVGMLYKIPQIPFARRPAPARRVEGPGRAPAIALDILYREREDSAREKRP